MKKGFFIIFIVLLVFVTMSISASATYNISPAMAQGYLQVIDSAPSRNSNEFGDATLLGTTFIDMDGDEIPELFVTMKLAEMYTLTKSEIWHWNGEETTLVHSDEYIPDFPTATYFIKVGDQVLLDEFALGASAGVFSYYNTLSTFENGELTPYKNVQFTVSYIPFDLYNGFWFGDGDFIFHEKNYTGVGEYYTFNDVENETQSELEIIGAELAKYGFHYNSTDNFIEVKDENLLFDDNITSSIYNDLVVYTGKTDALSSPAKVLVNGVETAFDAYNINGNNYFKLRDLANVVSGTEKQFEVTWDEEMNAINLISGEMYTEVGGEMAAASGVTKEGTLSTSAVYVDGVETTFTAYNIDGNNYFKLRDVAKVFDIGITWDGETSTIGIDTAISYVE